MGETLRSLVLAKGSLRAAARATGVSAATWSKAVRGISVPDADRAELMGAYLGITAKRVRELAKEAKAQRLAQQRLSSG